MKKSGSAKGGFGKNHGGAANMQSKLVTGPMAPAMVPKGGGKGMKSSKSGKGY